MQPFAENYITLHTEHSYLPVGEQPRYLVFSCMNAPTQDSGGQTLIRSSKQITEALSSKARSVLESVSYARGEDLDGAPTFLQRHQGQMTVCFRDYDCSDINWMCRPSSGITTAHDVREAMSELFRALYDPQQMCGIPWRRGDVWVIDNFRYLHGKTFYPAGASSSPRWLQRIMIKEDAKG